MFVKQISVFLENKAGKLAEFTKVLADNNIDLQALLIAETQDYGILRIIVDNPDEATEIIKKSGFAYKVTEALAITVPDEPGSLTKILASLADEGISIKYSYAFYSREHGKANIVLRVDDNEKASEILEKLNS
ncbi:MAG: acetolactate synthase [Clostridia bacterium]|nr:acetolactate synthase [Clostridia bacterium]